MSHLVRRRICAAVACATVATPLALTHDASQARTTSHTLRFTSHSLAGTQLGATGFGGTDKLLRRGRVIGYDVVNGSVGAGGTIHLRGAFTLAGGLMYVTATVNGTTGTGRIVGGTGRYAGARGTVRDTITDPAKGIVRTVVTWTS